MVGRLRNLVDLTAESVSTMVATRITSVAVTVGMALGAAAFVGISGISTTLSNQLSDLFDERLATTITARSDEPAPWATDSGLESLRLLPGVVEAGSMGGKVETVIGVRYSSTTRPVGARVVSPEALDVIGPRMVAGVPFRRAHAYAGARVALLPVGVARTVGLSAIGQEVVVGGERVRVVGVFDGLDRRLDLVDEILINGAEADQFAENEEIVVEVQPGWGPLVAPAVALALRPDDPGAISVSTPLDPEKFRLSVEGSVRSTGYAVSLLAVVVSALMLANVTASGVVARYSEIGMRRALGAPRWAIAGELVVQSVWLSLGGALAGVIVGIVGVTLWAAGNGYRLVFDLGGLGLVWLVSLGVGLVAGLAPAVLALRVPPVTALRS
ncbi:MAG TPA: FtsX-like permease family protein [Acidimicrobiales bacterium]|nr:FtsX-like permease family protein [Acidimicrobiales bacterium]